MTQTYQRLAYISKTEPVFVSPSVFPTTQSQDNSNRRLTEEDAHIDYNPDALPLVPPHHPYHTIHPRTPHLPSTSTTSHINQVVHQDRPLNPSPTARATQVALAMPLLLSYLPPWNNTPMSRRRTLLLRRRTRHQTRPQNRPESHAQIPRLCQRVRLSRLEVLGLLEARCRRTARRRRGASHRGRRSRCPIAERRRSVFGRP